MKHLHAPNNGTPIAASALFEQGSLRLKQFSSDCQLLKLSLKDGIDLVVWKGNFDRPVDFDICDDINRVNFSCALSGCCQSRFDDAVDDSSLLMNEGSASINFNPGRRGTFTQAGNFESVTVMLRPDVLWDWAHEIEMMPRQGIETGRYLQNCICSAELRTTAQALSRTLCAMHAFPKGVSRLPLWLLGQSAVIVSLILEAQVGPTCRLCELTLQDQQKLLHARDYLLKDLSCAPTLLEIAYETGLSMRNLKRGFRSLFNNTVYGLFQQERMHEARRLLGQRAAVLTVAADLGYTNASHFAAAFKKQFGVNPSEIKCYRAGPIRLNRQTGDPELAP